jgi:CDP-2,3-bis-(O-geranylgeranyl)-sn-glycerol synthase
MSSGAILFLLVLVNGAPILAKKFLRSRWNRPVDGGHRFIDGRAWFGDSKTWRGLAAALMVSGVTGTALGLPPHESLLTGAATMAGDLFSSFIKRRLGISPSGMALGLDQIPEALFPQIGRAHV